MCCVTNSVWHAVQRTPVSKICQIWLSLFGPFERTWIDTALLMAALPPALNVFVFARQYDSWVEQASSAVLIGTLVSVVTLTSVMWMVKTGTLPQLLFR